MTVAILGKFTKQPTDVLSYDIDYTPWLEDLDDTITSYTVAIETGATIVSHARQLGVIRVFVAGGTNGQQYKVTCTATTTGGRVKQAEIVIKVKEV